MGRALLRHGLAQPGGGQTRCTGQSLGGGPRVAPALCWTPQEDPGGEGRNARDFKGWRLAQSTMTAGSDKSAVCACPNIGHAGSAVLYTNKKKEINLYLTRARRFVR